MSKFINKFIDYVDEVSSIKIEHMMLKKINFSFRSNKYEVSALNNKNILLLYDYFSAFEKNEKIFFGFPLFDPIDKNLTEFISSYKNWKKEKNSWNVFILQKKNKDEILAVGYIKKIGFKNKRNSENKSPTWFNSVKKKYRKVNSQYFGYSLLIGLIVHIQAELKGIKVIYTRGRSDNKGVLNYHKKLGYSPTGRKFYVEKKDIQFVDVEWRLRL